MTSNYIQDRTDLYLRQHRINELFEDICTSISFEQPSDVKAFIINQLKIKQLQGFKTGLYSPEEVDNIFTLFDLRREGSITKQHAKEAIKTMAASQFQFQQADEILFQEKVGREEFLKLVEKLLGIKTKR